MACQGLSCNVRKENDNTTRYLCSE